MSNNTVRQDLITAFDTAMKAILVTGGYSSNLGNNVFPWRECALDIANDELPALVYKDTPEESVPVAEVPYGKHDFKLTIEVLVVCAEGVTTPESVRLMIADVMKAVGANQTWGGLAIWTEPVSDEIMTKEEKDVIGGAKIIFQILYRTKRFDPFST